MGEKKGKALALELIDDLLNDEGQKPDDTEAVSDARAPAPAPIDENSKTLDISEAQAQQPGGQPPPPRRLDPNDATIRVQESRFAANTENVPLNPPSGGGEDKVRASVGRFGALRGAGAPTPTEAALAQSESLRIAQSRILELENELERVRLQNEELGAAGMIARQRADELLAQNQKREADYQFAVSTFEQERGIMSAAKDALQRDLELAKRKSEELELRISTNIQKIRVRERELENRLELMKMESAALIRSKDEMILELKRNIDQLNLELNNFRNKNQELNRLSNDKQEMLRRTVKALRLALSMLEGEEEQPKPQAAQRKAK